MINAAPLAVQPGSSCLEDLFTVFDVPSQVTRRIRQPERGVQECLQDAVQHSWLPNPLAHVITEHVPGCQFPQIIVYSANVLPAHQPLVIAFSGLQTLPLVCNFPVGQSLAAFFGDMRVGRDRPGHGVIDVPGGFSCFVDCLAVCLCRLMQQSSSCDLLPLSPPALPETAGTGDTELLHLARAEADRATTALTDDGPHTCFDARLGPRFGASLLTGMLRIAALIVSYLPRTSRFLLAAFWSTPLRAFFALRLLSWTVECSLRVAVLYLTLGQSASMYVATIDVHQDSFLYEVTGPDAACKKSSLGALDIGSL